MVSSNKPLKELTPRIFRKAAYGMDKFILVQKNKIHFVEAGQGEPVILIPGSYSTYRTWNRLMPCLAGKYRLIAPDYLGVGVRGQTDILARMVRQLKLEKVNLIGGFSGGPMVFDFAARYPELTGKIVSIEGSVIKPDTTRGDAMKHRLKFFSIGKLFVPVSRGVKDLEEEAKSIKTPILFLYGTQSNFKEILLEENIQYLKTYLPQAWIVALEGGIHDLARQKPAEVADLILEFLSKKLEPRTG